MLAVSACSAVDVFGSRLQCLSSCHIIEIFSHRIEVDKITRVLWAPEQWTVMASETLPFSMEVISHHANEVQVPVMHTTISILYACVLNFKWYIMTIHETNRFYISSCTCFFKKKLKKNTKCILRDFSYLIACINCGLSCCHCCC